MYNLFILYPCIQSVINTVQFVNIFRFRIFVHVIFRVKIAMEKVNILQRLIARYTIAYLKSVEIASQ